MPKSRSVSQDPQPGDVLIWKGYKVTVAERKGDIVSYNVEGPDGYSKRGSSQELQAWSQWASAASVKSRGLGATECVDLRLFTANVACASCEAPILGPVHSLGLEFYCGDHCPAAVHHSRKEKASAT